MDRSGTLSCDVVSTELVVISKFLLALVSVVCATRYLGQFNSDRHRARTRGKLHSCESSGLRSGKMSKNLPRACEAGMAAMHMAPVARSSHETSTLTAYVSPQIGV